MKISNVLYLATNPVWSLNATMQHKQDITGFFLLLLLFETHWKRKWAAFLNTLACGRVACPNGLHCWRGVLNFGPLSIIVNWRIEPQKEKSCAVNSHIACLRFSVCGFSAVMFKWQREKTPMCDRPDILV